MELNATGFEVAFVIATSFGLATSVANYLWARARYNELTERGENGLLKVIRRGARDDQFKISVVLLGKVIIGVTQLFAPNDPRTTDAFRTISGSTFLVITAVLIALSVSVRLRPSFQKQALEKHPESSAA